MHRILENIFVIYIIIRYKGVVENMAKTNKEKIMVLLKHAKKDKNLCIAVYHIIAEASHEEQEELFKMFLTNVFKIETDELFEIPDYISNEENEKYHIQYREIVSNCIKEIYIRTEDEQKYYHALYEFVMYDEQLGDVVARAIALFICAQKAIIPYRKIDMTKILSLDEKKFEELSKKLDESGIKERLVAIEKIKLEQATERAALFLNEIESLENYDMRVMLLATILKSCEFRALKAGHLNGVQEGFKMGMAEVLKHASITGDEN